MQTPATFMLPYFRQAVGGKSTTACLLDIETSQANFDVQLQ